MATAVGPVRTSVVTDAQKQAYEKLVVDHACRICGEAHPFTCPYVRHATLRSDGSFVSVDLRDEFFRDYVGQIPHGPADIEVAE